MKRKMNLPLLVVVLGTVLLAGCGKAQPPAAEAAASNEAQGASAPEANEAASVQACKLITPEEMAALAGKPIQPNADEGYGRTGCVWEPPGGGLPRVELKIEWGAAEAAMAGMGMLNKHEPGITNEYEGIGDEAVAVGPALMIKRDEDLVTIVLSGVDDADGAVRKIYDTASARM